MERGSFGKGGVLRSFLERVARVLSGGVEVGCALTFASEAKFEIEVKISLRLEAKKKPDFT